ncbi:hypothetical protein PEH87_003669 [Salmonella enterica]|nr:hypothetical protein [Salmonella enterica]
MTPGTSKYPQGIKTDADGILSPQFGSHADRREMSEVVVFATINCFSTVLMARVISLLSAGEKQ